MPNLLYTTVSPAFSALVLSPTDTTSPARSRAVVSACGGAVAAQPSGGCERAPLVGLRCASVGSRMPPAVLVSALATLTHTRSPMGVICARKLVGNGYSGAAAATRARAGACGPRRQRGRRRAG